MTVLEDENERLEEARPERGKGYMEIGSYQIGMGRTYRLAIACCMTKVHHHHPQDRRSEHRMGSSIFSEPRRLTGPIPEFSEMS